MCLEVLVDDCERTPGTLAMIEASQEVEGLKLALKSVFFMYWPFAVRFDSPTEAETFADRIRRLGFNCKVWDGPDKSTRVSKKTSVRY